MISCPFCDLLGAPRHNRLVARNHHAAAIIDGFPVSEGHTLILPRRHVPSVFELSGAEQSDVWALVAEVRDKLKSQLKDAAGFNIGPNDGLGAGQTVMHAHVHLIPRFAGDVPDPRCGIRWVLPRKANYWAPEQADPFQQVEFLSFVQSLFEHGQFVSTYKFALLQALADISLEADPGADGCLSVPVDAVAAKFIAYYWGHAAPFHLRGGEMEVLSQNNGPGNITVLTQVADARIQFATLAQAKASGRTWTTLLNRTARIKEMPLFKLQTVAGKQTEILYPNEVVEGCVVLHRGVQDCFRRFYGIVVRLARRAWLDMVRRLNPGTIGAPLDLEEFLFGSERSLWPGIRPVLREIQAGRCFYCQRHMKPGQEELDHFIPWSLYPNDLAHNFVLACKPCNGRKSDELASVKDLNRWIERNRESEALIATNAASFGLPADAAVTAKIAAWAYAHSGMTVLTPQVG